MQVVLVMFLADGARRSFPLKGDVTVVGRREDCDLRIPLTEVSRKHCRLVKESDGLRVEDLGSSNGTYHNGSRVQDSVVQPGDQLQVGPVIFTVQIDGFPSDNMITPPQTASADVPGGDDIAQAGATSSGEPARAGAFAGRPLTPQGDDFALGGEDEEVDDDVIDMNTIISPPEEEEEKQA